MTGLSESFDHAIVIGASIAGMVAAGAASKRFRRVTVVEREELLDSPDARRGVPQGDSIHVLLPAGLTGMEAVFPGLRDDLVKAGGTPFDKAAEVPGLTSVGWRTRVKAGEWIGIRRPLLDQVVRRRLWALANVEVIQGSVNGLELSEDRKAVSGVVLRNGTKIEAELVVNATGRRSKIGDWLVDLGFDRPEKSFCNVYTGYATQYVRLPEDAFDHGVIGMAGLPWPGTTRGVSIYPIDNGLHVIAAVGILRDYPPRDRDGVIDYLAESVIPVSAEIARKAEPVSEVHTYHTDGDLMWHWDRTAMPDRLLVVGDAVASHSPFYGQGMSLAATEGVLLQSRLATADDLDGFAGEVQKEIGQFVRKAFAYASSLDSSYEGAEWSDDVTPTPAEAQERGRVLDLLSTERADVCLAINQAMYNLRFGEAETDDIAALCDARLAESSKFPSFDPDAYPAEVLTIGS